MAKVLIAEDEPALLECYCELVRGLGHECLEARDGEEAIQLARQHTPDLVVTDFMMPKRNGLEVFRALQADAALRGVPVVLISAARPRDEDRKQVYRFLQKPIGLDTFERMVMEGLTAAERVASTPASPDAPSAADESALTLVREDMLNWVAHEIKSPLSAAFTATQLAVRGLRQGEGSEDTERRLGLISKQLSRMDELVNSILDAARLQDGRLKLDLETFDLGPWLETVVGAWREVNPDFEITCRDGAGIRLVADPERLRQVIDNLISNAIKYGQPSRHIEVDVVDREDRVEISVRDHGRGIAREHLDTLFNRFHRVPGQGGRGHGLGLYIASALTRLHGGEIQVESEPEKGARFTVTLPRADQDAG